MKQSGGGMIGATVVLTGLLWLLSKMVGFELSVLIGISLVFAAICDLHSNLFGR